VIRLGLVGVNTSHAGVFTGIFNGAADKKPALDGARVVAVWGDPSDEADALAQKHKIQTVVEQPTDMLGKIDAVLVVDDTGGGATHAGLARPFIEANIPTFIDKPMTLDLREAVELFDLAEQHNTPLMSSSALRYAVEVADLQRRLPNVGEISSVVSVGPGDWYYYGVHAVEMYQTVIGEGALWVHRHAFEQRDVTVVGYADRPTVVVETLRDASYVFHLVVYGSDGHDQCEVKDAQAFYTGLMAAVLDMVQNSRSPVSREETLEVLGVLHAGLRSAETGHPVLLAEVLSV